MDASEKISKLRDFFEQQGITQEEIARQLGVHKSYVNQLMTGNKQFGKGVAKKWSDQFGLSYTWLLTGEGNMLANGNTSNGEQKGNGNIAVAGSNNVNSNNVETPHSLEMAFKEIAAQRRLTEQALERLSVSQQQITVCQQQITQLIQRVTNK